MDTFTVGYLAAFGAGVVSFASRCVLLTWLTAELTGLLPAAGLGRLARLG